VLRIDFIILKAASRN